MSSSAIFFKIVVFPALSRLRASKRHWTDTDECSSDKSYMRLRHTIDTAKSEARGLCGADWSGRARRAINRRRNPPNSPRCTRDTPHPLSTTVFENDWRTTQASTITEQARTPVSAGLEQRLLAHRSVERGPRGARWGNGWTRVEMGRAKTATALTQESAS